VREKLERTALNGEALPRRHRIVGLFFDTRVSVSQSASGALELQGFGTVEGDSGECDQ
jgi:hypothetical protein